MIQCQKRSSRGFTLTEVIIAMFILSVVAIALNTALLTFVRSNRSSRETTRATALGNQVLERLRLTPFGQLQSGSDTVDTKYYRVWTLDVEPTKATATVSISWPLASAGHSIQLSTIISR